MEVFDFGLRLQELRRNKGLTQSQAARRLGVNHTTISAYERNLKMPSIDMLVSIAYLYGASIDYILGLEKQFMLPLPGLTESQRQSAIELLKIFGEAMTTPEPKDEDDK